MSKSKWGSTWTTSRPGIPNGGKSESFVLRAEELNIPFTAWSPCVRLRRGPVGEGSEVRAWPKGLPGGLKSPEILIGDALILADVEVN